MEKIFTVGHSTRPKEHFLEMLLSAQIELLVDVRSFPGSRKYPWYNKENMEIWVPEGGVAYTHMRDLGGRRKVAPDSHNTVWRHIAFRGYADYMETASFYQAAEKLKMLARRKRVAIMCSEAVWWRCHRSMIADYLKADGWMVMHIMEVGKQEEHPYTSPATIVDGRLVYGEATEM